MSAESDRLERAGRYVLGMMDEAERQRAERDLEFDAPFRAAVVGVAERMHLFQPGESGKTGPSWETVASAITALPHMRGSPAPAAVMEPAAVSRRIRRPAPMPGEDSTKRRTIAVLTFGIVAFVAGYLTALMSGN